MPIGLIFWVLMLLWMIALIGRRWGSVQHPWIDPAGEILQLILFFLLGWHAFGFMIRA